MGVFLVFNKLTGMHVVAQGITPRVLNGHYLQSEAPEGRIPISSFVFSIHSGRKEWPLRHVPC